MNSGFPTHQLYEKESVYETYIYKKKVNIGDDLANFPT